MYNALHIQKTGRILVVAPHPDDESVGCGGLLARFGPQCDLLLLTDGRKGTPADGSKSEAEIAAIRKAEFDAAAAFFRVNRVTVLNLPDSQLWKHRKEVSNINLRVYDKIFVPYRMERHPDHATAFQIIRKLHRIQHAKGDLLEYEVWSPIIAPNRFLDISEVMEKKLTGIRFYVSQVRELNYEALAIGLNGYRGAPHHVSFCEAYYSEAAEKKEKKQAAFARLPSWLRKLLLTIRGRR